MRDPLRLSLVCGLYDRTLPLLTGLVKPEGIELELPPLRLGYATSSGEADVYETPLPRLIIEAAQGHSHQGLAVFPKRTFFHQLILTNGRAAMSGLEDFRGKRVGLLHWYQHAMGVWLRGHLQDALDIAPGEMQWVTDRPDLVPWPVGVDVSLVPEGKSLLDLLLAGDLDILVHEAAHAFLLDHPDLRRMFPDPREPEAAYFREVGCVPINHALAIRRSVVEEYPWVVASLREAFDRSKETILGELDRNSAMVSSPWTDSLLEAQRAALGRDVFPNGLEDNRRQLETVVRYMFEQGFIPRPLGLDEIFVDDEI